MGGASRRSGAFRYRLRIIGPCGGRATLCYSTACSSSSGTSAASSSSIPPPSSVPSSWDPRVRNRPCERAASKLMRLYAKRVESSTRVDARERFSDLPRLSWDASRATEIDARFEFVLRLGPVRIPRGLHRVAHHGVWHFDHERPDQRLPLFREFYAAEGVTHVSLISRAGEDSRTDGRSAILEEGYFRTDVLSYASHRRRVEDAIAAWPARACERLPSVRFIDAFGLLVKLIRLAGPSNTSVTFAIALQSFDAGYSKRGSVSFDMRNGTSGFFTSRRKHFSPRPPLSTTSNGSRSSIATDFLPIHLQSQETMNFTFSVNTSRIARARGRFEKLATHPQDSIRSSLQRFLAPSTFRTHSCSRMPVKSSASPKPRPPTKSRSSEPRTFLESGRRSRRFWTDSPDSIPRSSNMTIGGG